jgi:hypothetical protein
MRVARSAEMSTLHVSAQRTMACTRKTHTPTAWLALLKPEHDNYWPEFVQSSNRWGAYSDRLTRISSLFSEIAC